ncbi:MAG: HAD family phosphatase [Patescibacteria group bacterium]|nr:HAD family phosphatase [Patescibacteria group bacterium]
MITTIIFDLSEVFLSGMRGVEKRISKAIKEEITSQMCFENETEQLFHGKITEEEYWKKVIKKYKWNITTNKLKMLIRENMVEIDGTREIVEKLKKNGYRLGLLSVHAKEWVEHCEQKFNYHNLFHSTMYSFEVGVCKPELKAFELILKKLKVTPQECVFVDDWLKNIEAAKKLNINTIHFQNPNQLKTELLKLQVNL